MSRINYGEVPCFQTFEIVTISRSANPPCISSVAASSDYILHVFGITAILGISTPKSCIFAEPFYNLVFVWSLIKIVIRSDNLTPVQSNSAIIFLSRYSCSYKTSNIDQAPILSILRCTYYKLCIIIRFNRLFTTPIRCAKCH